jgi:uncharacterized phage-associated protein
MIITHSREKLINAIIYFAKNTKFCGKIKLMKLLYFLDFRHFKETGKSVTGLEYYAWEKGPVPKELFEELDDLKSDLKAAINVIRSDKTSLQQIVPKRSFDDTYFSNREKRLLEELSYVFENAKAEEMVEVSHLENEPWHRTLTQKGQWQKIDYLLAIDNKAESLSNEEAQERKEEIEETRRALGST